VHTVVITMIVIVLIGVAVVLATHSLFTYRPLATFLRVGGLLSALTALTIGVHAHGWVTNLDAAASKWAVGQRSWSLDIATRMIGEYGHPATAVALTLISAAWLSHRARSVVPGAVVLGTVVAATVTKTVLKAVVLRPRSSAEAQLVVHHFGPTGQHMFPSGHVTGTGALLGSIAVCLGVGRSRAVRTLLAGVVGVSVLVMAVTLVHVGVHWLTDVIGGALLAALFVTLGAEVIRYFHFRSARNAAQYGAHARSTTDIAVVSAGR